MIVVILNVLTVLLRCMSLYMGLKVLHSFENVFKNTDINNKGFINYIKQLIDDKNEIIYYLIVVSTIENVIFIATTLNSLIFSHTLDFFIFNSIYAVVVFLFHWFTYADMSKKYLK
jgi:hypothetical protein